MGSNLEPAIAETLDKMQGWKALTKSACEVLGYDGVDHMDSIKHPPIIKKIVDTIQPYVGK